MDGDHVLGAGFLVEGVDVLRHHRRQLAIRGPAFLEIPAAEHQVHGPLVILGLLLDRQAEIFCRFLVKKFAHPVRAKTLDELIYQPEERQ